MELSLIVLESHGPGDQSENINCTSFWERSSVTRERMESNRIMLFNEYYDPILL